MAQIHYKTAFKDVTPEQLNGWIKLNYEQFIGSAIFTKQNTLGSKLVQWGEKHLFAKCNNQTCFTPSHTGSIIDYKGELYIFDMKPPKATVQPLAEYLLNTKEDYILVLRDFDLDTKMFSQNLIDHIGESYPYLSALRSVFTKRQSKWRTHCSELHYRQLLRQGIDLGINPECTPDELLHALIERGKSNA